MADELNSERQLVGWREWGSLPQLGIHQIRVKVDTGAKTSALHAERLEYFTRDGKNYVRFTVHKKRHHKGEGVRAIAEIIAFRRIKSSIGHVTRRPVIRTTLHLGTMEFPIQLSLVDRKRMIHPMLLGRRALNKRFHVDPSAEFLQGKPGKAVHDNIVLHEEESK